MEIIKSTEDKRNYRYLELHNKMSVLLISDGETEKAAACLRVRIGSFHDPPCLMGLAHFLEHMLFLGTETFPEEGFFEQFLQEHAGNDNAETGEEGTSYYFDIHHSALLESLPKFASFFICPLLRRESSQREINAVQSEFEMNIQSDCWRLHMLNSHLSSPKSPIHKFSIGNTKTLLEAPARENMDLFEELKRFYENCYSSHLMDLCVLGKESLDELERNVVRCFSSVPLKEVRLPLFEFLPFEKSFLQKQVMAESVKQSKNLHLQWMLPPVRNHWRSKPQTLASHLIGHEGNGGLFSFLQKENLINYLSSGPFLDCKGIFIFYIKIKLTEFGVSNIHKVIYSVFQYIEMLKKTSECEWRRFFDEMSSLETAEFTYKGTESPFEYTKQLAQCLELYPPRFVLKGPYTMDRFEFSEYKKFVCSLSTDNFRYFFLSKNAFTNTQTQIDIEPHFGTRFTQSPIDPHFLQSLQNIPPNPSMALPPPNRYISKDHSLSSPPSAENNPPKKIRETAFFQCFHQIDRKFRKPHAFAVLRVLSPAPYSTPEDAVLSRIFLKYTNLALKEDVYCAALAGLHATLHSSKEGFTLEVNGYSEKLPALLENILAKLAPREWSPRLFAVSKEMVERDLESFEVTPAYKRSLYNVTWASESVHWHNDTLRDFIKGVETETFASFARRAFGQSYAKLFLSGNLLEPAALRVCDLYEAFVAGVSARALVAAELPGVRCVEIPENARPHTFLASSRNAGEPNSSVAAVFQVGPATNESYCLAKLLDTVCGEFLYKELRTKENLGYFVSAYSSENKGVISFTVVVQGTHHPLFVFGRIMAALERAYENATCFTEEKFGANRMAVLNQIQKRDETLKEEVARFWAEIANDSFDFERQAKRAAIARGVTREEFAAFFAKTVFRRRRLLVSAVVNENEAKKFNSESIDKERFLFIRDIEKWKSGLPLCAKRVDE